MRKLDAADFERVTLLGSGNGSMCVTCTAVIMPICTHVPDVAFWRYDTRFAAARVWHLKNRNEDGNGLPADLGSSAHSLFLSTLSPTPIKFYCLLLSLDAQSRFVVSEQPARRAPKSSCLHQRSGTHCPGGLSYSSLHVSLCAAAVNITRLIGFDGNGTLWRS